MLRWAFDHVPCGPYPIPMSNPTNPNPEAPESTPPSEPAESFKDLFSEYEKSHALNPEADRQRREGTVIALTADAVILDIGFKSEGLLAARRTRRSHRQAR